LAPCKFVLEFGLRGTTGDKEKFMAKSSSAHQERVQRTRERDASLAAVRGSAREAVSPDLDRLIHERIRLGIVSALAVNRSLTFNELKALLKTTDGNLSVHARKLEEADYIVCTKSFDGRLPKTEYRLTASGRRALERYLNHMEALIRATREG
jgi:DNA-binding HxlR family transcriptional regulator